MLGDTGNRPTSRYCIQASVTQRDHQALIDELRNLKPHSTSHIDQKSWRYLCPLTTGSDRGIEMILRSDTTQTPAQWTLQYTNKESRVEEVLVTMLLREEVHSTNMGDFLTATGYILTAQYRSRGTRLCFPHSTVEVFRILELDVAGPEDVDGSALWLVEVFSEHGSNEQSATMCAQLRGFVKHLQNAAGPKLKDGLVVFEK